MNATTVAVTGTGLAVPSVTVTADLLRAGPVADTGDDPLLRLRGRGLRYKDRATKLALSAGRLALQAAGLLVDDELTVPASTVGVVVSTNLGNVDTVCETAATIAKETYLGTSPMLLPATASNVVASWTAIAFGLRGANLTLCNGPTSGLDAVHWARLLIAAGRVRHVLVVGVEPANDPVRHLIAGAAAGEPAARVLDGAAALVLEPAVVATDRRADALAQVGPYARRGALAAALSAVHDLDPRRIGLWLPPAGLDPQAGPDPQESQPAPSGSSSRADLAARFGECSGALGVLQCVAATGWLAAAGHGSDQIALAAAGRGDSGRGDSGRGDSGRGDSGRGDSGGGDSGGDDAAAALVLAPAAVR
jgi:3-oxoacyl-[acyl-carrier-protein] synthase II